VGLSEPASPGIRLRQGLAFCLLETPPQARIRSGAQKTLKVASGFSAYDRFWLFTDSYFGNPFEITLKACLKAGGAFLQCFLEGRLDSSHSRPLISADLRAIARINRLPARSDRPRTQICPDVPGHSTKTTPLSSSGDRSNICRYLAPPKLHSDVVIQKALSVVKTCPQTEPPAKAFRDRSIVLSDVAHVRPKTFSIDSCVHLQESHRTLRDGSFGVALSQALRARLRSHRPSGTFQTSFG
jgi:hypothetical protein